jgi:hypothetical protein
MIKVSPQYYLSLMSRREQPPPKPPTIRCNNCGEVVAREKAFFTFDFECCSTDCANILRHGRISSERAEEEKREAKRPKCGAFTFQNGGSSTY